jgi:tyrosinase
MVDTTRRSVLKAGMALGATAALAAPSARAQTLFVRPDINSPAGQEMLALYAQAVQQMQDPAVNYPPQPHSWTFQAYIHGLPADPFHPVESGGLRTGTPQLAARIDLIYGQPANGTPQANWKTAALKCWGTCPHGSPWFVAWHRWYIFYFERIIRSITGVGDFSLPYWNYASDQGASLQLPSLFQDFSSALYEDTRGLGFANGAGTSDQNVPMNMNGYMPYSQTDYSLALSAKPLFPSDDASNFAEPPDPGYFTLGFAGRLEIQPHDNVHDNIGGIMSNVPTAAMDPIFFVHHCQIDRLWAAWQAANGSIYNWGTTSTGPSQAQWISRKFSFVDAISNVVTVTAWGQLDTEKMGYEYDKLPAPPQPAAVAAAAAPPSPQVSVPAMQSNELTVGSGGGRITLAPLPEAQARLMAPQGAPPPPPTLVLKDVQLLSRPPAPLHVFLNLPEGTAPALNSPYHVGVLNFFNWDTGTGGPMTEMLGRKGQVEEAMPSTGEFRFSVGQVLSQQRAQNLWNGSPVTVTVTTLGADQSRGRTYVKIGQVQLLP